MHDHDPQAFIRSALYMSLSAASLSLVYLFIKLGMGNFPLIGLIFLRFAIPFLLLLLFFGILGGLKRAAKLSTPLRSHLLRAGCVVIAQASILFYMTKNSLLNATVLVNAGPLFIPILERLFLKQRIGKSTVWSLGIAGVGVLLLLQPREGFLNVYTGLGLLAALMQAVSQVLYGMHARQENQSSNLFYLFLIGTLLSLSLWVGVFWWQEQSLDKLLIAQGALYFWLFLMGCSNLANQFFRGLAYRAGRPTRLAPFLYLSVFLSGIFDWVIFHNTPNFLSAVGALLVVLGGVLKVLWGYAAAKKRLHH